MRVLLVALFVVLLVTVVFFVVLRLLVHAATSTGRGMARFLGRAGGDEGPAVSGTGGQTCPDQMCRKVNPPQARYCARCGRALRTTSGGADR